MRRPSLLYVVSFGVHAALAIGVLAIEGPRIYEDVSVAVFESAKAEPERAPPPPPPEPSAPAPAAAAVKTR
ncbi:MAG: hypothetical protein JWP97_5345, partial [Labilithrix sp.]|nr:hypothetical protein [Labilithrix sp.]